MNVVMKKMVVAVLLVMIAQFSYADLNVGLGVGQSNYEWNGEGFDSGNAFELNVAYFISTRVGVELAYNDLGDAHGRNFEIATRGTSLGVTGNMPLADRVQLFAKLAFMDYQSTLTADSPIFLEGFYRASNGSPVIQPVNKVQLKGEDLMSSIGLSFQVNPAASVYLRYSHYDFDQSLSAWMAGVSYAL